MNQRNSIFHPSLDLSDVKSKKGNVKNRATSSTSLKCPSTQSNPSSSSDDESDEHSEAYQNRRQDSDADESSRISQPMGHNVSDANDEQSQSSQKNRKRKLQHEPERSSSEDIATSEPKRIHSETEDPTKTIPSSPIGDSSDDQTSVRIRPAMESQSRPLEDNVESALKLRTPFTEENHNPKPIESDIKSLSVTGESGESVTKKAQVEPEPSKHTNEIPDQKREFTGNVAATHVSVDLETSTRAPDPSELTREKTNSAPDVGVREETLVSQVEKPAAFSLLKMMDTSAQQKVSVMFASVLRTDKASNEDLSALGGLCSLSESPSVGKLSKATMPASAIVSLSANASNGKSSEDASLSSRMTVTQIQRATVKAEHGAEPPPEPGPALPSPRDVPLCTTIKLDAGPEKSPIQKALVKHIFAPKVEKSEQLHRSRIPQAPNESAVKDPASPPPFRLPIAPVAAQKRSVPIDFSCASQAAEVVPARPLQLPSPYTPASLGGPSLQPSGNAEVRSKIEIIRPDYNTFQSERRQESQSPLLKSNDSQASGIPPARWQALNGRSPTIKAKYSRTFKNFCSGFDPRDVKNLHNLSGRVSSQTKPRVIYSSADVSAPISRIYRENYPVPTHSAAPVSIAKSPVVPNARLNTKGSGESTFQAAPNPPLPRVKKRSEKCATVRDILERTQQSAEESSTPTNPRALVKEEQGSEIISQNATTPAPDSPPKIEAFSEWQTTPPDILRKIVITDVKVNAVSVTFRECKTPIGFFKNRT